MSANGYTYALHDGEQSFRDFAMGCAGGFGATYHFHHGESRDIPETLPEPSTYHLDELAELNKELTITEAWSESFAEGLAQQAFDEEVADNKRSLSKHEAMHKRFDKMTEEVGVWKPPSEDHVKLQDFMFEQLEQVAEWNKDPYITTPVKQSGEEYKRDAIKSIRNSIKSHADGQAKDSKKDLECMEWIDLLRNSLDN